MNATDIVAPAPPPTNVDAQITAITWERFWAFTIDSFIISWVIAFLTPVFGIDHAATMSVLGAPADTFFAIGGFSASWAPAVIIAYYFIAEWLFSTTVGKRAMGLVVVNMAGSRPRWWQALLRNIVRPIDYYFFCIGFFLVLFTRWHQRCGDDWAQTLVVKTQALTAPPITRAQARHEFAILVPVMIVFIIGCAVFEYYGRPPLVIAGMYNTQQAPFSVFVPTSQVASGTPTCITGYSLGTPVMVHNTITYPVTYHFYMSAWPDQHGYITLRWTGFTLSPLFFSSENTGWVQASSEGPSSCPTGVFAP